MKNIIASWSGGKDSAMSVYSIMKDPTYQLVGLLSIVFKNDDSKHYIGMHMIDIALIKQQSDLMGIKLFVIEYIDDVSYQKEMKKFLNYCLSQNVEAIAFGDIHLQNLRESREQKLKQIGMSALFPLWNCPTTDIIKQFISIGFKAKIVNIDTKFMNKSLLGTDLNNTILNIKDIDVCGENGEYHTLVYDGPIFKSTLQFELADVIRLDNQNRFLSIISREKPFVI